MPYNTPGSYTTSDAGFVDPSPYADIAERQRQQAMRQKAIADQVALARQQLDNRQGGRMVGKFYVPGPSPLVPAATSIAGSFMQPTLDRQQQALNAEEQAAAQQLIKRLGGIQEQRGPSQEDGTPPATTTRPLTHQERLATLQQGTQLPSLRDSLTKAFQDQLVQEPIREEARRNRVEDREDAQASKRDLLDANLEQRREQLKEQARQADIRAADARASAADRAEAARTANAIRQQLADLQRDKFNDKRTLRDDVETAVEKAGRVEGAKADARERAKEGAQARTRAGDASNSLSALDRVDALLKKGATGSYVGTGVDQGLRAVGLSTKGGQNAEALKVLSGELVSKMPKMSGPQSDKDVALYREMAGRVGDSTLPVAARQAAVAEVRRLQQKYAAAAQPPGAVVPAGAPAIGTIRRGYRYKGGDPSQASSWERQ